MMLLAGLLVATAASAGSDSLAVAPACLLALAEVRRVAAQRGWEAEAHCVGRTGSLPSEAASLSVEPLPVSGPWRSGPLSLMVRAEAPGRARMSLRVAVRVAWWTPAWTATRALGVGELMSPENLQVATHRWADGTEVRAAMGTPPQGRLRRAVRAGDAVQAEDLVPADGLLRGDRLEAVLASGGVEIRTPVVLLTHARIGERVRVQVVGRADVLDGRLVSHTTVMMEGP